jgi:hypothetical protein
MGSLHSPLGCFSGEIQASHRPACCGLERLQLAIGGMLGGGLFLVTTCSHKIL